VASSWRARFCAASFCLRDGSSASTISWGTETAKGLNVKRSVQQCRRLIFSCLSIYKPVESCCFMNEYLCTVFTSVADPGCLSRIRIFPIPEI
jgi:hypothetical protein